MQKVLKKEPTSHIHLTFWPYEVDLLSAILTFQEPHPTPLLGDVNSEEPLSDINVLCHLVSEEVFGVRFGMVM